MKGRILIAKGKDYKCVNAIPDKDILFNGTFKEFHKFKDKPEKDTAVFIRIRSPELCLDVDTTGYWYID